LVIADFAHRSSDECLTQKLNGFRCFSSHILESSVLVHRYNYHSLLMVILISLVVNLCASSLFLAMSIRYTVILVELINKEFAKIYSVNDLSIRLVRLFTLGCTSLLEESKYAFTGCKQVYLVNSLD